MQRQVTQLNRLDDKIAGANGRSWGYLKSLQNAKGFGATSRCLSSSYDKIAVYPDVRLLKYGNSHDDISS